MSGVDDKLKLRVFEIDRQECAQKTRPLHNYKGLVLVMENCARSDSPVCVGLFAGCLNQGFLDRIRCTHNAHERTFTHH
jgi:hypothetical protein